MLCAGHLSGKDDDSAVAVWDCILQSASKTLTSNFFDARSEQDLIGFVQGP